MPTGGVRPSCTIHGCDELHSGRGYCYRHYNKLVRIPRDRIRDFENPKETRRTSFWRHLYTAYRVRPEAYGAMYISQGYRCGICGVCLLALSHTPCVDHDHDTGAVRGLLCRPCNTKEGWFVANRDRILSWQERGR